MVELNCYWSSIVKPTSEGCENKLRLKLNFSSPLAYNFMANLTKKMSATWDAEYLLYSLVSGFGW